MNSQFIPEQAIPNKGGSTMLIIVVCACCCLSSSSAAAGYWTGFIPGTLPHKFRQALENAKSLEKKIIRKQEEKDKIEGNGNKIEWNICADGGAYRKQQNKLFKDDNHDDWPKYLEDHYLIKEVHKVDEKIADRCRPPDN